jgi:signal transduction histidine kinase
MSSPPGQIAGDRQRLLQAINHILDNAVRYGKSGGQVLVATHGASNAVEIGISDDGMGISAKDQASIFDGFSRARKNKTKGNEGQGLGLPIARQLIESHGGTLMFESKLGEGTTIIIKLPRE